MSEYFELAYAAGKNRLCLFTGTGFSKAVTNNQIPSWQDLLVSLSMSVDSTGKLKATLFPESGKNPLPLEEAAQVISLELQKNGKSIHDETAALIGSIKIQGDNSSLLEFFASGKLRVLTTNYDKLAEELVGIPDCHSLTPGLPIPRSDSRVKVYHVHGSIDSPENMIITADDYFRFMNNDSYFSRKLSTMLHENTVVILGYSLADTNLKSIISDHKNFSRKHAISSNLFLVSRSNIDQSVKDYYAHSYGIRVIDGTTILAFFQLLNAQLPIAKKCSESSVENIQKVINGSSAFTPGFLKIENSFYEIVSSLAAIGISINDARVVAALGQIISTKSELTSESNAWTQYVHLARWLIHLASILELEKTSIEPAFLAAVLRSMNTMRKELYIGYSWYAFKLWEDRWFEITPSNRALIKKHIEQNTVAPDALWIVSKGY